MRIKDREKHRLLPDALNYSRLRALGIEYLQGIAGNVWSDYNPHDPGVTILELLCYSLVDLGYRTSFEMRDLLTKNGSGYPETDGILFQAHEILPCSPVTTEDYRKLILEALPSVRNVTFKAIRKPIARGSAAGAKQTRVGGFYKVLVELKSDCDEESVRRIVGKDPLGRYLKDFGRNWEWCHRATILNILLKHRNLCEDFRLEDVVVLKPLQVGICANIEIRRREDYRSVLTQIDAKLHAYVSSSLPLHTLGEMIAKGKRPEEIYQGENPKYGFIDRDELRSFEPRRTLYASDVLALIMGVEGVNSVSHLNFVVGEQHLSVVEQKFGCHLSLREDDEQHALCFQSLTATPANTSLNRVVVLLGGLPLRELRNVCVADAEGKEFKAVDVVYPLPKGVDRQLGKYYSIQDLFPEIYKLGRRFRLGEEGLSKQPRAFERLQLKAYLLIFEQLIADYQAQLASVGKLLSWKREEGDDCFDLALMHTALSEAEVADVSLLLDEVKYKGYLSTDGSGEPCDEQKDNGRKRWNRVLDHLLARFGEEFVDYSILSFWNKTDGQWADFDLEQTLGDKRRFLSHYAEESARRTQSIDYTDDFLDYYWEYSPVETRIMRKLGIDNPPKRLSPKCSRRRLKMGEMCYFDDNSGDGYNKAFGIHIIEHILLVPTDAAGDEAFLKLSEDSQGLCVADDPYTMQLTILVPGWLEICKRYEFRLMVERVITEELPAHVAAKVCWVDPYMMMRVEDAYDRYLKAVKSRTFQPSADGNEGGTALSALVSAMGGVRNIYPPIVLGLCDDANCVTRLNYSALGEDGYSSSSGANWRFKNATKCK